MTRYKLPVPAAVRVAVSVLLVLLLTTACVSTTGSSVSDDGRLTLTIATGFTIDDLDPLDNGVWGVEFGYAELLMRPERDGAPTPWVLTDLANPDPSTWVLTLPAGASFVNGRPLDAAALAELLSFALAENPDVAAALPGATAVATGPLQVTLTTTRPTPNVATLLADESMVPVFDAAAYRAHRDSGASADRLVRAGIYTGPFVVEALDARQARLVARPDHWAGPPALDGVTIRFVPEGAARVQAVQAGEVDLALYPSTATAPALAETEDAFYATGEPTGPSFRLELNQRAAPFDDVRVRRGIHASVDYRALAEDVMSGLYQPATGLYVDAQPWAIRTQAHDPALASRLLDQAGWIRSGDGPRTRGGQELRFTLLTYPQQPDSEVLALALQAQLGVQGITMDIRQVPDLTSAVGRPDGWQGAVRSAGMISFGGDPLLPLVNGLRSGGETNYQGVADPELDALIDQVAVALGPVARDALLRRIQVLVAERGYLAYVGLRRPAVVTSPEWREYEVPGSNLWIDRTTAPAG